MHCFASWVRGAAALLTTPRTTRGGVGYIKNRPFYEELRPAVKSRSFLDTADDAPIMPEIDGIDDAPMFAFFKITDYVGQADDYNTLEMVQTSINESGETEEERIQVKEFIDSAGLDGLEMTVTPFGDAVMLSVLDYYCMFCAPAAGTYMGTLSPIGEGPYNVSISVPASGTYTNVYALMEQLEGVHDVWFELPGRNEIKKIDPKFIPDSVKNTFLVTAEYNDDGTGIDFISHTFDEIYNAHSKGKNIFLNVSYSDTYYLAYIDDGGAEFVNLMPLVVSDIRIYQDGSSELLIYNLVDFEDFVGFIEYVLQHQKDSSIHVTEEEKKEWNEKADLAAVSGLISGHTKDSSIHVSEEEKSAWNNKVDPDAVYSKDESLSDATKELYGLEQSAVPNDVLGKLQTSVLLNKIHLSLPETPYHWRRVAFGNGMFVAIPVSGNICAYSHDGIKWEQSTLSETSRSWQSVCFGAGKFVALASNYAAYSVDGVTWVESSIPTGAQWFDVAYGNGRFVAIALNRVSAYSEDGLTWTETQFPGIFFGNIGFGNGTFIVSGSDRNRYLYYGVDGITWNQIILPYSNRWTAPCYGKDKFVLVAYASASCDETNCALYSEDGITWEETYLPCNSYWYRVDNVNGIFVAVSMTGKLAYSTDGINWAESNSPPSSACSVAYGNGIFVAVSQEFDYASYSRDGIKWKDEVYILNDVKSCGITEYVIEALLAANQEDLKGNPGYTPQRGVDYWTTEDQQAIVDAVLAALPNGDEEEF